MSDLEELDDGTVELELDDDIDSPEESGTRQERKRDRYDIRLKEAEAAAREYQEKLAKLEGDFRELKGRAEGFEASFDDEIDDPLEERQRSVLEEQKEIQDEWNALEPRARTPEMHAKFSERLQQTQMDLLDIVAEKRERNRPQQPQVDPALAYQQQVITAEYGDVVQNQRAMAYADGLWLQMRASGREDSLELKREALQTAREKFATSSKRGERPGATDRERHSGVSGRAGAAAGPRPGTVRLTKEDMRNANALYNHIPDEKARYKLYAKEILQD